MGGADARAAKIVERQMRNWELARAQRVLPDAPRPASVHPFLTISRMVGAGGDDIAASLSARLGWFLADRTILQMMAGDDHIRRRFYESMDERDLGWLEEAVRSMQHSEMPPNDYVRQLTRTVLAVARRGSAVFLGRAADLILPRHLGLRVRLIAPMERCIETVARARGVRPDECADELETIERERARFAKNHFGDAVRDPSRFDLTINVERFSCTEAESLIMWSLGARGLVHDTGESRDSETARASRV